MGIRCFTVLKFINIVSILFYNFIEFIVLLYIFLIIYFAWYKEYIICLISFSKFSDVLPAFTCANVIVNLWSICLRLNILNCLWSNTVATWFKIHVSPFHCFPFGNIPLSKSLKTFCFPLRSIIAFLRVSAFFSFSDWFFWFCRFFKNININF